MTVFAQRLLRFLPLEHEPRLSEIPRDLPPQPKSPKLDVVRPESPAPGSGTLQSQEGEKMFAACDEMWCLRVSEPTRYACFCRLKCVFSDNNAGWVQSPRAQRERESHLPGHSRPVINPSAVCQKEQQKAAASSWLLTAPQLIIVPNISSL